MSPARRAYEKGVDEPRVLSPWKFSGGDWRPGSAEPAATPPTTLKVATFNVWFEDHEFESRAAAILLLLRESGADVIALQEVKLRFLERALREPWIRDEFTLSDADGSTIADYGVILLSRLPVLGLELYDLPSTMGRQLLTARVAAGKLDLVVATTHLESLSEFGMYREEQLRKIFRVLEPAENALLLGDFNFCSSSVENEALDERYADLWPLSRPEEPGWTVDGQANAMRRSLGKSKKRARYDRIFARSNGRSFKIRSIRLLGTEPVSPELPDLFPSDHFGVWAELGLFRSPAL